MLLVEPFLFRFLTVPFLVSIISPGRTVLGAASCATGVGSRFITAKSFKSPRQLPGCSELRLPSFLIRSSLPSPLPSTACGVGSSGGVACDDPYPVAAVGRTDTRSRNNKCLDGISDVFKVFKDAVKNIVLRLDGSLLADHFRVQRGLCHADDASNIFANNEIGSDCVNCAEHRRPEVAVVFRSPALSGKGKWLTWEASGKDVDASAPNREVCCGDVVIGLCVRPVMFQDTLAEWIYFAVEGVCPAHPLGGKVEATGQIPEKREPWVMAPPSLESLLTGSKFIFLLF